MICPACGAPMRLEDKDTSSGNEVRSYVCQRCGRNEIEHRGKALWEMLSDAREESEARAAAAAVERRTLAGRLRAALRRWRSQKG